MAGNLSEDVRRAIEACHEKTDLLVRSFTDTLEAKPTPATIYHYTGSAGFRGIIESGKLWFTDLFNLNDPSELSHGVKLALEHMRRVARDSGAKPEINAFVSDFTEMISGGIERVAHFFVCCFSRNGDDLGQWRAYGDDGRGYAVGFDTSMLETRFAKPTGVEIAGHATFPITYNDDELHRIHREIISDVTELLSVPRTMTGFDMSHVDEFAAEAAISFALPIIRTAMFFKHKAYNNEAEYRFLDLRKAGPVDDVQYRHRPYSLVRYVEHDWKGAGADVLKEIVIGPAADKAVAARFVDDCLRAFHSENVHIRSSEIPYRVPHTT